MVQLSYITQNAQIPANVEPYVYVYLKAIWECADKFLWRKEDDFVSSTISRRLDDLAGGFNTLLNAFVECVKFYRTDLIYDMTLMHHILGGLGCIDLLHELPVFIIGLRESGTDSFAFIESRLKNGQMKEYEKILLLTLRDTDFAETVLTTYICEGRR